MTICHVIYALSLIGTVLFGIINVNIVPRRKLSFHHGQPRPKPYQNHGFRNAVGGFCFVAWIAMTLLLMFGILV